MGRRGEPRVAITLPVVVRGTDIRGTPFVVNTETREISCSGARLNNLNGIVVPGQRVEIQCNDQKATFRVQWVGEKDTPRMGQAGLRCLEPGKYIWGIAPKEWEPDTYDPANPLPPPPATLPAPPPPKPTPLGVTAYSATASYVGRDRRQFLRHSCRIAAQVTLQNSTSKFAGTITDISLGGCYIETFQPLPVNTFVELYLHPGDDMLQLSACVRSSHSGAGMGVAFTGMSPENFEKLRKFAPPTLDVPTPEPAPAKPAPPPPTPMATKPKARPYSAPDFDPIDLPPSPEVFAAVVRILFRRGLLTRTELMEELEKMKVPQG